MSETWRPIPLLGGGYEASDEGRIRSFRTKPEGQILNGSLNPRGYLMHGVGKGGWSYPAHVLVTSAWLGPRPDGMETRHLDGNPANNAVTNLAYGTHAENMRDSVRHGTHPSTSKTHCPQGHPYDAENTVIYRSRRTCRVCTRVHQRAYRERKASA